MTPLAVPRSLVTNSDPTVFDAVARALRTLPEKVDDARPRPDHPPWAFIDRVPPTGLDPARIHAAAVTFDNALAELQARGIALDVLTKYGSPGDVDAWSRLTAEPCYPLAAVDGLHTPQGGQAHLTGIEQVMAHLRQARPEWLSTVTPAVVDLDVPAIHAAAVAADESGFFGRKKRRRAVVAQLTDVLAVDPAAVDLKNSVEAHRAASTEPRRRCRSPPTGFGSADPGVRTPPLESVRRRGRRTSRGNGGGGAADRTGSVGAANAPTCRGSPHVLHFASHRCVRASAAVLVHRVDAAGANDRRRHPPGRIYRAVVGRSSCPQAGVCGDHRAMGCVAAARRAACLGGHASRASSDSRRQSGGRRRQPGLRPWGGRRVDRRASGCQRTQRVRRDRTRQGDPAFHHQLLGDP